MWKRGQQAEARKVWAKGMELDAKHKVLLETMQRLNRGTSTPPTAAPGAASAPTPAPASP